MRWTIQVKMTTEEGETTVEEIATLHRDTLPDDTLGLTLAKAKDLLATLQSSMVDAQVEDHLRANRCCADFGTPTGSKVITRSCIVRSSASYGCQVHAGIHAAATNKPSPIASVRLSDCCRSEQHRSLTYLSSKWASLMAYGMTAKLMGDVLPMETNVASLANTVRRVGQRMDDKLGDEQHMYIDGVPRDWAKLPRPGPPITVGIDGGYVRTRDNSMRWMEAIVGKSIPENGSDKCFGFIHKYDTKSKRRLFEILQSQGLQMNQQLTFLSDRGEVVRELQYYLSPESDHLLDWFHVTMRLTVMNQMAKGLPVLADWLTSEKVQASLERSKWYLWNGNVYKALQVIESLEFDLECYDDHSERVRKLYQKVYEFRGYILDNHAMIPNYSERYRYGEKISTAMAESTVNQVIGKRFRKKQQMRWSEAGAHWLLQVRTKVLNEELADTFSRWYPHAPIAGEIGDMAA